jgi:FtsH-binding integral membrane protein
MKISGLGFLVTGLILIIFPIVNLFVQDEFVEYMIPCISLVFCTGLFVINFKLHKQTKSDTPWKGSLYAVIFIIIGIIISMFKK